MTGLPDGGAAGQALRSRDWSSHALGPVAEWPLPLRLALQIVLAAQQPMFVTWGQDQSVIYNDAYAALLQHRHPAAFGAPFLTVFPEAAGEVAALMQRTLSGEAHHRDDIAFMLLRGGALRETHFSYSHTPLRDECGTIRGIFCICADTTAQIEAERRAAFLAQLIDRLRALTDATQIIDCAAELLGRHMAAGRCGYGEMDDAAIRFTVLREWTSDGMPGLPKTLLLDDFGDYVSTALRAGQTVALTDTQDESAVQGTQAAYQQAGAMRAGVAVPLLRENRFAAAFYVHDIVPRAWTDHDIALIGAVADQVWHAVERNRAAAFLQENEERLRLATDAAEIGLWDVDPERNVVLWSPRVYAMFGIPAHSPLRIEDFHNGLHPEDRERVGLAYRAAQDPAQRALYDVEYRTIGRVDGAVRWVAAKGRGLFDADGKCVRVVGTAIDITQRRIAAQRLRESEAALGETMSTLDALLANAPIGLAFFDAAHRFIRLNETLAAIHGIPVAAHIGRRIDDLLPAKGALVGPLIDFVMRHDAAAEPVEIDGETPAAPGDLRSWFVNVFPVRGAAGDILYAGLTIIDITERRRAEAAVRQLNETLEARVAARTAERDRLWRNTQDLQLVIGRDGVVHAANPAVLRLLGWPEEAMVGQNSLSFVHPEDRAASVDALSRAVVDQLRPFENRFKCRNGAFRWIAWVAAPDEGLVYASGRDIDAEKKQQAALLRAEEALRQAQKMEAIGQLTGGIAHDFNNLLQGVTGSLDLIRRRPDDAARVKRFAEAGLHAAERGARLTGQLLAFSRVNKLELKPLPVARILRNTKDLLERTIGPSIEVVIDMAEPDLALLSDEVQIEMALLNLAINARDAMPEGGVLTIAARRTTEKDGVGLEPGDYVELSVRDTGAGMPPDVAARAFDPFFTTKGVGKGSGLGLSQVYGTARQGGGGAYIESRPGAGTIVRLLLHAVCGAPDLPDTAQPHLPAAQAEGAILVVDDDADVRAFFAATLEALGYRLFTAENGEAGLALLHAAKPDVLIVDFAMPGMNGAEVARRARALFPDLPVIFATGFADSAAIEAVADAATPILRKPFRVDDLAQALEAVLRRA